MNIFELLFFGLLLWIVCLLTIEIHRATDMPLWLVSFMVVGVVVIVAATVQRLRKPTASDAKED